jgi:NADPH2:quinone reductase
VAHGRKSWRGWTKWYATTATVARWGLLSPRRGLLVYPIQRLREGHQVLPVSGRRRGRGRRNPDWFREDFNALLELLREDKLDPVVAEQMPLAEARHAHELLENSASKESSCSYRDAMRTLVDGALPAPRRARPDWPE